jgi:putative molybdopterin biosynthesis protein
MTTEPGDHRRLSGTRLRLARLARNMAQSELAELAGVTRQAIAGIEAGRWDPSLRVALALSRGLDIPLEEIFGPAQSQPDIEAEMLGAVPRAGVRVESARVAGRAVALPLVADRSLRPGFGPSSGVSLGPAPSTGRVLVRGRGLAGRSVVVAGCDPALPLLGAALAGQDPPVGLSWWPCSSSVALGLAAAGLVHAAGVHQAEAGADLDSLVSRHLGAQGAEVFGFARWREGLVWGRTLGATPDLASGVERGLRLVNREPGSEARSLLDATAERAGLPLAGLPGYATSVSAHLLVTSAVAAGVGELGVASEPCALAYDLPFTPLASERSLLVVATPLLGTAELQALLRALASTELREQLAGLPGYDVSPCGESVASVPAA